MKKITLKEVNEILEGLELPLPRLRRGLGRDPDS